MVKILVVDDDPIGTRMVQFLLTEEGYEVETVDNPRGAMVLLRKQLPDLILLDVNMPQVNGFEFYTRLSDQGIDIPVIFITAKGELEDRLRGLRMGADDYITKPFAPAEMVARVEAVLRRYRKTSSSGQTLRVGNIELRTADLCVVLPEKGTVYLTPTEMKVLVALVHRSGQVVSRDELLTAAWGESYIGDTNIVDVYIRRLRRKIEPDPAAPRYLQAARGLGYKLIGNKS
jgi:DNA-binding response OmpR family regulator